VSSSGEGQIVTFYSYKGGTGRTMALANIAWILASNGQRVLAIDWDLESPGLHKFFHPFLDGATITDTPGVIDIIRNYQRAAIESKPRADDWHLEYAQILQHAVSLDWDHFEEPGTLDFLSAGQQNRVYSANVSGMDWDDFYDRLGGGQFFDALRADMKRNYDYVLIDSRTGISDIADVCTVQFPDVLVDCFTLNDQSIDGAAAVAKDIDKRYHERKIRILPVPMRIVDSEKEKHDIGRNFARLKFSGFPSGLSPEQMAQYWRSVEIPFKPYYAFEEILATFGDDPGSPISLLSAFERLTGAITNNHITTMPPFSDEIRLRYKQAFTRRQPVAPADVYLSYVAEDRMWSDWIESILTRSGFRVLSHSASASASSAAETDAAHDLTIASHIVVVLSSGYLRSPQANAIWESLRDAEQSGAHGQLIPIKVDEARLSGSFLDRNPVEIAGLDASQAIGALMRKLDRPAQLFLRPADDSGGGPRYPRTAPEIWNVPSRNAAFTGRSVLLERLRDQLLAGGPTVVLAQALYGLGGVGKTQVALEYAHRFMADYDLVWWISAEGSDEIASSLAELALRLGIQIGDDVVEAAHASLEELRRSDPVRRWLLIFDNADDPRELQRYLPTGPGHVVVTSRDQAWSQIAEPIEVDVFSREESVAHLLLHVPQLDRAEADRVATTLGDLPLAIEQAGAWLRETGMPAASYVEQLDTHIMSVLSLNRPTDYPAPAVATWNLSLARLRKSSPAGVRLLQLCAFFSPGPISMNLLYSDEMIQTLMPFDNALVERVVLGRVIREISRFALVKVDQGNNSIQIHRLVQAVIISQMTEQEQMTARHQVHKILVGARPRRGDTDDPGNWPRYTWIWPHLMPSRAAECEDELTRQLLIDHVRYMWLRGDLDVGMNLATQLDELWTATLGADHRQTLHLRFHIANLLRSRAHYSEARDLDTEVLERQREVLPSDHPHTLMTAGSLAADLRGLGEFDEALRTDEDTYNRLKEQFGEDHPRTLAIANNLAVSLRLVGDCFTARQIDRETFERRRDVLGADHPYTLHSSTGLARDMREAGEFAESVELLRVNYDKYRAKLGEDLMATLRTAKSLAVSLRKNGEQLEAKRLTEETYGRYLVRYGKENPDALSCALNLACDYSALDDKVGARELVTEVRTAYQNTLGEEHPYTLIAANNLVTYLRNLESPQEAFALAGQTLDAMRRRLGANHPYTLSCAVNTANCLADCGNLDEAIDLLRSTAERLEEKLGRLHPDTLVCQANLAVTLRQAERLVEAEPLRERLLVEFGRKLGENHPDTIRLQEWRCSNRDLEPQPT
jgi:MinD-like ATPase involved in chromosome partitioning or flagellar assembly